MQKCERKKHHWQLEREKWALTTLVLGLSAQALHSIAQLSLFLIHHKDQSVLLIEGLLAPPFIVRHQSSSGAAALFPLLLSTQTDAFTSSRTCTTGTLHTDMMLTLSAAGKKHPRSSNHTLQSLGKNENKSRKNAHNTCKSVWNSSRKGGKAEKNKNGMRKWIVWQE